jgi:NAD(P)-dependent dehydrogenase (short-subunit alcohol dehydrogenase family)
VDVLINIAGIPVRAEFFETTADDWVRLMDVDLKGMFFCALEAAQVMIEWGGGIVSVSTNRAALGVRGGSVYAASKSSTYALTRRLAVEFGPHGIRVNTIALGPTLVRRNLDGVAKYAEAWGSVVPLRRIAAPQVMGGAGTIPGVQPIQFCDRTTPLR